MSLEDCIYVKDGDTHLRIIVRPGSGMETIVGIDIWRRALLIKVRDPAVKGRANSAVVELLTRMLDAKVAMVSGHTSSQKSIYVELEPTELIERLRKIVTD